MDGKSIKLQIVCIVLSRLCVVSVTFHFADSSNSNNNKIVFLVLSPVRVYGLSLSCFLTRSLFALIL
jgi:hypothetical protein